MKRLLAKLPRSSSGSREASASSSASRWPFDIFEVSITGAGASFDAGSFTPVSALICSGGASSGVFIKPGSSLRVFAQQIAGGKFLARAPGQSIHFFNKLLQSVMIREAQRSATERREAGAHHHAKVSIPRCRDDLFFQAPRGFVHHQEDETVRDLIRGLRHDRLQVWAFD